MTEPKYENLIIQKIREPFYRSVFKWAVECFGAKDATNKKMRNDRFVEEAVELVQSLGYSKEELDLVVDYVYNRPAGIPYQEVGGVMVTLAALCAANGLDLDICADIELNRVWDKIDVIRKKHAAKPPFQPEPVKLMKLTETPQHMLLSETIITPDNWTSMDIDGHTCAVFIVTKMDDGPCKAGQRLVEFLKNARIPA